MRLKDAGKEAALLEAAVETIVQEGFDGLSMHKLARKAGISVGTIYLYFENREDLILKVYHTLNTSYQEASLKGFDPNMNMEEGLKVLWKNRFHYLVSHPNHFYFLQNFINTPLLQQARKQEIPGYRQIYQKFLDKAIKQKEIEKLPFEVYWSVAFAPLYQLVKFRLEGNWRGKFDLSEKPLFQALNFVLHGLIFKQT